MINSRLVLACPLLLLAACGSELPDTTVAVWVLKPAANSLTGIRSVELQARPWGPASEVTRQLRDDLVSTERFAMAAPNPQASITVAVGESRQQEHINVEELAQGSTVRRYTRKVTQVLLAQATVREGPTGKVLARLDARQSAEQPCGMVVVNSDDPLDPATQRGLFPPAAQSCDTSHVVVSVGRMLAQRMVPHYEQDYVQLYTLGLPHGAAVAERASVGDWEAAEKLARSDEAEARQGGDPDRRDKAAFNLAVVLNATGQPAKAAERLKKGGRLKGTRPYEIVSSATDAAKVAQKQAQLDDYTPHRLPSL